ncbi:MAG: type I pullulanase [Muribaculaceae bacterium]
MNKSIANVICVSALMMTPELAISQSKNAEQISIESYAQMPVYAGDDMELTIDGPLYRFCLWSPLAQAVRLRIYDNGQGGTPLHVYEMQPDGNNGVWRMATSTPLMDKFYTFQIKYAGQWLDETPGVWAKALGVNGKRAAIIDMAITNPKGWLEDRGPEVKHFTDVVLYEMHHRDFSMHINSGIVNKGKFVAMLENGTLSLNGQKTGIDHLKELGITHVHILPSFDYNSVDESNLAGNQYNWGYDPINYNAPDGSYSTNPADPYTRIKEMKLMVQALHKAGIGVVMDVVYNHTGVTQGSNFELTVPGYFYRQRTDGSYSDASGCGNETASERRMMHDYIVNSVCYWAKEYHIDGFRFDLMAIHDINTMNDVAAALKQINPSIFVYGEGWTAGDSPLPVEQRALKVNVAKMNGIAVFSDDIRDAVKGHYANEQDPGFASGKPGNEETVKIGIVAATAHPQVNYDKGNNAKAPYATSPEQIVNYVSCHDDLCLTDKLAISMPGSTEEDRIKVAKLAQTIVLTSQGTPFIFAGEEVFRSKKGVHNSYKSPDDINAIDWNQKLTYHDLFNYYAGLIDLRKSHPAFRMTSAQDIARNLRFDKVNTQLLISYSLLNHANGDSWKEIKLVFNGSDKPQPVKISKANWMVIAKDGRINKNGLGEMQGGEVTVSPRSALILAQP